MKIKKVIICVCVIICAIPIIILVTSEKVDNKEYKINKEYRNNSMGYKKDYYLFDLRRSDINGDDVKEDILVLGKKKNIYGVEHVNNLSILVYVKKQHKYYKIIPTCTNGLYGKLSTADFDGDKIRDIHLTLGSDDSGGAGVTQHCIILFKDNKTNIIFGKNDITDELDLKVKLLDKYMAEISNKKFGKKLSIDLTQYKKEYENDGIYSNGKLKNTNLGGLDSFTELSNLDNDKDGIYELHGTQYFYIQDHSDGVGIVHSILKFTTNKNEWIMEKIWFESLSE